ncbi:hypothetical protein Tco_1495646, partial [Tanacetum coccineum]
LTTMRFIPQHEVVQRYGGILPDYLTNPAMKESEAYKTYHDLATGKKSSDEDDDDDEANVGKDEDDDDHDDDDKQTESDNDVQTPSYVESTDDEEVQGVNIEGKAMDEEENTEEDEGNELYRDLNVNLEGRDVEITDDQPTNVQTTQVTKDTHATSLVDVPVTTIAEPPLVSATTLPPPPTLLITHMQQTPVPTPTIVPSSSLQDLPNFGSLFGFDHRLKTLETEFFEFKQTNQFDETVSSIPGIVDTYLANKMNEAVKTVVQLQSDRLRDEALAENEAFLNSLDNNIKNIIKDQVKQQVNAQVSKILPRIEKTVNEQLKAKNLYKALVEAYESDKLILDTYGDTVSFKRRRDDEDKDEEPFAGSN